MLIASSVFKILNPNLCHLETTLGPFLQRKKIRETADVMTSSMTSFPVCLFS